MNLFFNFLNNFSQGVDMTMKFGKACGGYCSVFTEVQNRFVFIICFATVSCIYGCSLQSPC